MKLVLVTILFTTITVSLSAQIMPQAFFVNPAFKAITIGTQKWMDKNLSVTTYKDGTLIGAALTTSQWVSYVNNPGPLDGAWVYPTAADGSGNFVESNRDYGKLYNWYALSSTHGICPTNWHVPSRSEWGKLYNYLSGNTVAGGKIKEAGTTHWDTGNVADNSTGFTALPGGYMGGGASLGFPNYGYYWASDDISTDLGYTYLLVPTSAKIDSANMGKVGGAAIRCIHD